MKIILCRLQKSVTKSISYTRYPLLLRFSVSNPFSSQFRRASLITPKYKDTLVRLRDIFIFSLSPEIIFSTIRIASSALSISLSITLRYVSSMWCASSNSYAASARIISLIKDHKPDCSISI